MDDLISRKKLITRLRGAAFNSSRQCLVDGCTDTAISSHLLQKKGILSNITVEQHLYEIAASVPFGMDVDKVPVDYKYVGINQAMTLPLYCNTHDTQLFKDIEQGEIDHTKYQNQLLFAFRSCAGELRKKEVIADLFASMLFDRESRETTSPQFLLGIQNQLRLARLAASDLQWYLSRLETDLNTGAESFRFVCREISPLEVAVSALFTPNDNKLIYNEYQEEALPSIFVNVIPRTKNTYVIVGHLLEHSSAYINDYVEKYISQEESVIRKLVSDVIIKHCETWAMSPSLYNTLSEKKKEDILMMFHLTAVNAHEDFPVDINIFDN